MNSYFHAVTYALSKDESEFLKVTKLFLAQRGISFDYGNYDESIGPDTLLIEIYFTNEESQSGIDATVMYKNEVQRGVRVACFHKLYEDVITMFLGDLANILA